MGGDEIYLENLKGESQPQSKDFDDILEEVGSIGRYQRIFLYGVLFPLSVFESIFAINLWFFLDEPNHWCSASTNGHPLRVQGTGLEIWKNLTIPRNDNGQFSKCEMFAPNHTQIPCQLGWDYDFSVADYRSILTDYDWVCDKSHYSTLVHTATNTGRALGTLFLGFLADKIGRKPVFIITLILFSCGRAISMYFADNIGAFVAISLITGMSAPMFAISINTIALELSGKDYRAWIYSFTWMTVVIGSILVPTIALLTPNWFVLGWITISIGSISYLFIPWIPESPRWLLSKGRIPEVVVILNKVSSYNGTTKKFKEGQLTEMLEEIQRSNNASEDPEHSEKHSALELFSRMRIAKHTLLIMFTWIMNGLVFHGLNLNSLNLHGHRYLNFFLTILMEVPGGFFGGVLSNKFGRRWMQVLFFCICGIASVSASYFTWLGISVDNKEIAYTVSVIVSANIAKIASTMSFLVIYLQALELFPTPLRTTGSGLASTVSSFTIILVPYLVYTGKTSQLTPWIASAVMSFVGMTSAAFIPETMNHKLPETLDEAEEMGERASFWSYRLPKKSNSTEE